MESCGYAGNLTHIKVSIGEIERAGRSWLVYEFTRWLGCFGILIWLMIGIASSNSTLVIIQEHAMHSTLPESTHGSAVIDRSHWVHVAQNAADLPNILFYILPRMSKRRIQFEETLREYIPMAGAISNE